LLLYALWQQEFRRTHENAFEQHYQSVWSHWWTPHDSETFQKNPVTQRRGHLYWKFKKIILSWSKK
jgi:hypothetical protein